MKVNIGVIGEYQEGNESHLKMQPALDFSGSVAAVEAQMTWLSTEQLEKGEIDLSPFHGFWGATASPYKSMIGALAGIRYARENGIPFLGTCGGCQHAILEIARNVLDFPEAHHEEYDPSASTLFLTRLVCSLAGQEMSLALKPGSMISKIYGGASKVTERYYCNFGLSRKYEAAIESAGLHITGLDISKQAAENEFDSQGRIFELDKHPFFIATLFVPQVRASIDAPHPVITGFLSACRRVAVNASPENVAV